MTFKKYLIQCGCENIVFLFVLNGNCECLLNGNLKDLCECSEEASDPDGFKILVLLHQLLLQLYDLGHGLVLHVLQLLRHL